MVYALGVDINLVRSAVFGIGCGLAGLGGVLAAPLVTASVGMAATMIIDAFVIVIIGGMGSFLGSLIAALLIAVTQVFGEYYLPDLALAFMYLLMLLVLVVRPGGLARVRRTGVRAVHAYATGTEVSPPAAVAGLTEVTYNPFRADTFTTRDGRPVFAAALVVFHTDGRAYARGLS